MLARTSTALLAAVVLAWAAPLHAQERTLDIERFRPAPDRDGFLGVPGTRTPGPWAWNAALWLTYSSEPLSFRRVADGARLPVIRHRVGADLVAQLGLWDRVAVVLDAPVVLWQDGDPTIDGGPGLQAVAMRDAWVATRVRILGEGNDVDGHPPNEGAGLALQVAATLPWGLERSYAGEGAPQLEAAVLGDFHFLDFGVGGILGYRHRFAEPEVLRVRFANELFLGVALQTPTILVQNLSALLEVRVSTAVDDEPFLDASTSVEGDAGVRWAEGDVAFTWAVGMGWTGGVGTPGFRGLFGVEFAPRTHDFDGDGLVDEVDECVRLPEDVDGFQDEDGCPDPDDDGDLIPDEDDRCPREAADFDRDEDEDGCTDPVRDADGDGVIDDDDACPDQPEDADGFEDEDGCPDLDDDGDGIADADDACRTEAEDVDGFEDEDGCPDADDDGDGVGDADDGCPREAEDRDGVDDADGCPDPDDDRDGVLDGDDLCPDEAEDIDGRRDEDGCPEPGGRALFRPEGEASPPDLRGRVRFDREGALVAASSGAVDQLARHLVARWGARWEIVLGRAAETSQAILTTALRERGVPEGRFEVRIDAESPPGSLRLRRIQPAQ
ncbi:MAG: hypothetical protein VYE22_10545 [Myxococcota bacterium]|nr:hypothetical protein [Myxococcota bacterium]